MQITFYGAAQAVTGSKHLVEAGGLRILLDCGMHQGKRAEANRLNSKLPFEAASIDAVILSHAHADHCGMLPMLVREGFKGKIYCTAATADLAMLILEDAAMIQVQDAEYYNKHLPQGEQPIAPLYDKEDVQKVQDHFVRVPYFSQSEQWTNLNEQVRFKLYDAGHILGSAITLLEADSGKGEAERLAYTGDLGRHFLPILRGPEQVQEAAAVMIMESTYGGRLHRSINDLEEQLVQLVHQVAARKGVMLVPAFSLGRTQELVYVLHKLMDEKRIPAIPMYVDSPLAERITRVFEKYIGDFNEQFWRDFGEREDDPFLFSHLEMVRSVDESKSLNQKQGPFIVIAGSGMCEGGRILHHLKQRIGDPNTMIVITGYQAEHTLGRRLLEKQSPVKLYGREYEVKARVAVLNELSAHADQKELLQYAADIRGLQNLFLVHGEMAQAEAFKKEAESRFPGLSVHVPAAGQSFRLTEAAALDKSASGRVG